MRGTIKYFIADAKKDGRGTILIQSARVKASDLSVLLAFVSKDDGKESKKDSLRLGEWFQNHFMKSIAKGYELGEAIEDMPELESTYAALFIVGNEVMAVSSGEDTSAYIGVSEFGRKRLAKLPDDLIISIENDGYVLIGTDIICQKENISTVIELVDACIMEVSSQDRIEKAVNEISEALGLNYSALAIKIMKC